MDKANPDPPAEAAAEPTRVPRPKQLDFFEREKVLEARLGIEFFRTLPTTSGVYFFWSNTRKLLYLGKAKDLKQRLNSYRHTSEQSRKTLRLISRTHSITYELCENEEAALLRENHLLQTLRPPFNRMHVWPAAYYFLKLTPGTEHLRFSLIRGSIEDIDAGAAHGVYGAFKSSKLTGLQALFRLMMGVALCSADATRLPRAYLSLHPANETEFPNRYLPREPQLLEDFLGGHSPALVQHLLDGIPTPTTIFGSEYLAQDTMLALWFFEEGTYRARQLREEYSIETPYIKRSELDPLLIRFKTQRVQTEASGLTE